jgi:hypothetical protein
MLKRLLLWLLNLLGVERHEIGRKGLDVYLTRWVLFGRRGPDGSRRRGPGRKLFLHWFHRGDAEPYFHDHPFEFVSLILAGGYWEETPAGRRWYGPGSLLRRPATWRHRVELPTGRSCWTLVLTGPRVRDWGFWCSHGWLPWRTHEANQVAGLSGCGEEQP